MNVVDVCRFCLRVENPMESLFSLAQPIPKKYSELIETFTDLKISLHDKFPKKVCRRCATRLVDVFNFKKQCENADSFLKLFANIPKENNDAMKMLKDMIEFNNFDLEKLENINTQNIVVNSVFGMERNDNKKIEDYQKNYQLSMDDNFDFTNNIMKMQKDNLAFVDQNLSKCHIIPPLMSPMDFNVDELIKINEPKIKYECDLCGKSFETMETLRKHILRHDPNKSFYCKVPGCKMWSFETKEDLEFHRMYSHSKNKTECGFCLKVFPSRKSLQSHIYRHRPAKKHKCRYCDKGFHLRHHLKNHEVTHTGERPFLCQDCGRKFKTSYMLQHHQLKTHCDIRPFVCECGKTFILKSELKLHTRTHDDARPYMCSSCGKTFKRMANMKRHPCENNANASQMKPKKCDCCGFITDSMTELDDHMKIHGQQYSCPFCPMSFFLENACKKHIEGHSTAERPFTCPLCNVTFKRPEHLHSHKLRKHSNVKPLKCEVCNRAFATGADLKAHKQTHAKDCLFKCIRCGKAFSRQATLRVHMRMHTGEKPYVCALCNRGFRQSASLVTHLRTHSSDLNDWDPQNEDGVLM